MRQSLIDLEMMMALSDIQPEIRVSSLSRVHFPFRYIFFALTVPAARSPLPRLQDKADAKPLELRGGDIEFSDVQFAFKSRPILNGAVSENCLPSCLLRLGYEENTICCSITQTP